MKLIKTCAIAISMVALSISGNAQRIKMIEGDLAPLRSEKQINTDFTYEHLSVGKFDNESDYITKKKDEYNKKEPGKGDQWAKDWVSDRHRLFEPKFIDLFERESELSVSSKHDAKYTLIYKTTSMEPGYNIYISRKNAETDAEVWIVETANPSKVIAKITVENAKGRTFGGNDYETGVRLAECYADAGKYLGKFMRKQMK
ncbi:MAG: hypothetical protein ABJB86_19600 [Bacteroidota bacterium]